MADKGNCLFAPCSIYRFTSNTRFWGLPSQITTNGGSLKQQNVFSHSSGGQKLKSKFRFLWAALPAKALQENLSLPFPASGRSRLSLVYGCITPVSAWTLFHMASPLCVSSCEGICHQVYDPLILPMMISSSDPQLNYICKTLFQIRSHSYVLGLGRGGKNMDFSFGRPPLKPLHLYWTLRIRCLVMSRYTQDYVLYILLWRYSNILVKK